MFEVAVVADVLESSGGLELMQLQIVEGLAARGWRVRAGYTTGGDLHARWAASADLHGPDADLKEAFGGVDVLYAHDPTCFARALQLGTWLERPVVLHLHLPPFHVRTGLKALRGRKRYEPEPEVYGAGTTAARFLVVSRCMARRWRSAGLPRHRLHVVHNGVDVEHHRPARPGERDAQRAALGLDPDAVVFGFVGRLQSVKGIEELLEAFAMVRGAAGGPVQLAVVGELSRFMQERGSDYAEHLRRTAPPDVVWLGKRTDVAEVMRAFDVLVVPSTWEEPFGLVAVEGMATGLPVIASRRGGLPELFPVELADTVVPPRPRPLAHAMVRLARDPDERRRRGERGREHVCSALTVDRAVDAVEANLAAVMLPQRLEALGVA